MRVLPCSSFLEDRPRDSLDGDGERLPNLAFPEFDDPPALPSKGVPFQGVSEFVECELTPPEFGVSLGHRRFAFGTSVPEVPVNHHGDLATRECDIRPSGGL